MAKYRHHLPQCSNRLFLTDGGMETTLIFREGIDLPEFAAFDLLKRESGRQTLWTYYQSYIELALAHQAGFILESVTWRANSDWGKKLGYSANSLNQVNQQAIALLDDLRQNYETPQSPMVISGCIGPRGDGYTPDHAMTTAQAKAYHLPQIETLARTQADFVSALTMNYSEEAIGITQAAQQCNMPVVISFTVETDGKLPTGQALSSAIQQVDQATDQGPAYYMINCAHPQHFEAILDTSAAWTHRIKGLRANASTKSHTELDESTTLDDGNPTLLGQQHLALKQRLPQLNILGGCCGTDLRHIKAICEACLPVYWSHLTTQTLEQQIG